MWAGKGCKPTVALVGCPGRLPSSLSSSQQATPHSSGFISAPSPGTSMSKLCVTCFAYREPWHAWELTGSSTPFFFFQLDLYSLGRSRGRRESIRHTHNRPVVIWCNTLDTNKWLCPLSLLLHLSWDKKGESTGKKWRRGHHVSEPCLNMLCQSVPVLTW